MTPGRVLFVGLLLVAGVLYLLNPEPEAFREYLEAEAAARAREEAGEAGNRVSDFIDTRLGRRVSEMASDAFERENYYVASVYEADLNGRFPGGEWKFLGIAGWFTPIESPLDSGN